jgi:hypothetical protein
MVVRFLAMLIAVSMMGTGLTACHGGGGGGCDDSDGTPCAPPSPPATCSFPTGSAPTVASPVSNATVSTSLSQVEITDISATPYRAKTWTLIVSTDSDPDDFFDNTSAYVSSSALIQEGSTTTEIATLPRNALVSGTEYFIFIVTAGCSAAGPISDFFTQ